MFKNLIDQELEDVIKSWICYLEKHRLYSTHTVRAYITDIKCFMTFLFKHIGSTVSLKTLKDLESSDFRAWLADKQKQGPKPLSNARALSVIKTFFSYLKIFHNIENTSMYYLKPKKIPRVLPKALSPELALAATSKINQLIPNETEWVTKRDYAILLLLYGCGIRISEALAITLYDLESHKNFINIKGKGNKERNIPILSSIKEAIEAYIDACPYKIIKDQPIFLGLQGKRLNPDIFRAKIRLLKKSFGMPTYTSPHAFRHSFATQLVNNGVDIRIVQSILGHSSLQTTERYTKVHTSQIIHDYTKFHPRAKKENKTA